MISGFAGGRPCRRVDREFSHSASSRSFPPAFSSPAISRRTRALFCPPAPCPYRFSDSSQSWSTSPPCSASAFPPQGRPANVWLAAVFATLVVAIIGGSFALEFFVTFKYMPENAVLARSRRVENRSVYAWIEQHLPPNAGILSADDPLVYLYTGHPVISRRSCPGGGMPRIT